MNLTRLRELHKTLVDGSARDAELAELRDMLPKLAQQLEHANDVIRCIPTDSHENLIEYADAYLLRHSS